MIFLMQKLCEAEKVKTCNGSEVVSIWRTNYSSLHSEKVTTGKLPWLAEPPLCKATEEKKHLFHAKNTRADSCAFGADEK